MSRAELQPGQSAWGLRRTCCDSPVAPVPVWRESDAAGPARCQTPPGRQCPRPGSSRRCASAIRSAISHCPVGTPVASMKRRRKVRGPSARSGPCAPLSSRYAAPPACAPGRKRVCAGLKRLRAKLAGGFFAPAPSSHQQPMCCWRKHRPSLQLNGSLPARCRQASTAAGGACACLQHGGNHRARGLRRRGAASGPPDWQTSRPGRCHSGCPGDHGASSIRSRPLRLDA